ncbi:hypothetical protein HYV89_02755 [Candidatus Woesearchaeota archaeon]|nr:hypothetical protein [Candidatus Woesearchaeota archaeon]
MNIKDIPWFNRPGERLSQKGVEALSSSDLLKISETIKKQPVYYNLWNLLRKGTKEGS